VKKLIINIIYSSIINLFKNQPDVMNYTSETGMTEWNLGHHLSNELNKYLFWLDNDNDVTKRNIENHRPDAIFHKRGINSLNFLVVEIKKTNIIDYQSDIQKVTNDWINSHLKYRYGSSLLIRNENQWKFSFIQKDKEHIEFCSSIRNLNYIKIPKNNFKIKQDFKKVINEIVIAEQNSISNLNLLIEKLDLMVYKLYELTYDDVKIVEPEIKNE